MSFVIAASVVIAWAFKEEHATAEHALTRIRAEGGNRSGLVVVRIAQRTCARHGADA